MLYEKDGNKLGVDYSLFFMNQIRKGKDHKGKKDAALLIQYAFRRLQSRVNKRFVVFTKWFVANNGKEYFAKIQSLPGKSKTFELTLYD